MFHIAILLVVNRQLPLSAERLRPGRPSPHEGKSSLFLFLVMLLFKFNFRNRPRRPRMITLASPGLCAQALRHISKRNDELICKETIFQRNITKITHLFCPKTFIPKFLPDSTRRNALIGTTQTQVDFPCRVYQIPIKFRGSRKSTWVHINHRESAEGVAK